MRKLGLFLLLPLLALTLGLSQPYPAGVAAPAQSTDPVVVISSTAQQLAVGFDPPEVQFTSLRLLDGQDYTALLAGSSGSPETGKPNVPVFGRWILIPNGTTPQLIIDPGAPLTLATDILLDPVQIPEAGIDNPVLGPFVMDESVYNTDADFPGDLACLGSTQVMRGQEMAMLWLFPYQYNAVQRRLTAYPHMSVTLSFEGIPGSIPPRLASDSFEKFYRHLAINASEVLAAEHEAGGGSLARPVPGPIFPGWDYIILTPAEFLSPANKLATWREKSGFKTLVEVVSKKTTADDLKSGLLAAYEKWSIAPQYVLILGDAEFIPTHYRTWHPYNSNSNDPGIAQGYIASDLYYTLLHSSDPQNPEADLAPDIWIGRLSVDTLAQMEERVEGIIRYDEYPTYDANFYSHAAVAAQFQDGFEYQVKNGDGTFSTGVFPADGIEDRRFTQSSEDLAIFLSSTPLNKTIDRFYFDDAIVDPIKWNDGNQLGQGFTTFDGPTTKIGGNIPSYLLISNFGWDANKTAITNALNAGRFLIAHNDHGGRINWSEPYYATFDVVLLNNKNVLPVVWSMSCQTGWFDNETDFKKSPLQTDWTSLTQEAMSELWERPFYDLIYGGDYGAVGVVAATRISYEGYADRLELGMADAIWPDFLKNFAPNSSPLYEMAAVMHFGKAVMLEGYQEDFSASGPSSFARANLEGFHWFGDPATKIRTVKPPLVMAAHPKKWYSALRAKDLFIELSKLGSGLQPDEPLPGATVTIYRPDDPREYWVGKSGLEGVATFPDFVADYTGVYSIEVTADNSIPFSSTFESLPGPAGGIRMNSDGYTCSDMVTVKVADSDLAGTGSLAITLDTYRGELETLTLSEADEQPGLFAGRIAAEPGSVLVGDGVLQVTDGDVLRARYDDADDGQGYAYSVWALAGVDCLGPDFAGLQSATRQGCSVQLAWDEATDLHDPLQYIIYRSLAPGTYGDPIATTWAASYTDRDILCGRTYYYLVRAVDTLGNQDGNTVEKWVYLPGIFLPIILR